MLLLWQTIDAAADEHTCTRTMGHFSLEKTVSWHTHCCNVKTKRAHTRTPQLFKWPVSFTCWFTGVDPVRICNAGYCKDICCQKQAPWNYGQFIHVASQGSGVWRGKMSKCDPGGAERHRVAVISLTSPPSTGACCCGSALHFAATLAPSRQPSESLQLQKAQIRRAKASHLKCLE